jgi:hypothetical protein
MLAVGFLGLALAVCATVAMPWPSDVMGEPRARLVPHWQRLVATPLVAEYVAPAPDAGWVWRRAWDGLIYPVLLAGIGCAVWAAVRPRRAAWVGLGGVGGIGAFYGAGMVLYNGPLVATPGYLLVLFAALLVLLTDSKGNVEF